MYSHALDSHASCVDVFDRSIPILSTVDSLLEMDCDLVVLIVVVDPDHSSKFEWKLGKLWEVLGSR